MTNAQEHFDAIVIGAGQGGGPISTALANAGRRTAIIERKHAGGTCINEGCTPTKTMIASARVAHLAQRGADYGVQTGPVAVDLPTVRQRKRDIVQSWRESNRERLEKPENTTYIDGEARFTGPKTLSVALKAGGTRTLTADVIIINTGGRPTIPTIAGLADVPYLDSTSIMELAEVPDHLLIIGGGYISLEFAQMYRRFGADMTVIQRGPRIASHEDPDIAAAVMDILRDDGITILTNTDVTQAAQDDDGQIRLTVRDPDGERALTGSQVLVAVGRTPNTDALDPAAAGITTYKGGHIKVDAHLQTNVPGVYAIGDVNGGPSFTHISYDDFRILRANLIDGGAATTTDRVLNYVLFIDPQLGRIGLNETQARQQGIRYKLATLPMSSVARAIELDETRGLIKVLVDPVNGQILGAAVLGVEGGEIMTILQIAMLGHLPYTALRDAIFAHPTLAEGLNTLFTTLKDPAD